MKHIIAITVLFSWSHIALAQDLRKDVINVDTSDGHGYTVFFWSKPFTKEVIETFNNAPLINGKNDKREDVYKKVNEQFFRQEFIPWTRAVAVMDSMKSIDRQWRLPSIFELETIYKQTEKSNKSKGLLLGSLDWEGLYFFYWATNYQSKLNKNPNDWIRAAGVNGTQFGMHPLIGDDLINNEPSPGEKEKFKLILIKQY
ncbi:hypothetical protein J3L18_00210 [Mucilaginibacter gossypii]|uniref:hypothetical protein n=1 Tax=Mucilaginibacter gossypii TaxID=551996 RepID=UPI000DCD6636|nr:MULTISPECIES: hypothetical protein [Mucilaginibacter]QTE37526.1 hypothetical protein J3L18_00210 [Mucilaginibacter gossypii]RAV52352.1 hypothetical protein DIU36_24770 [Mucilaginibacter rubeus]